MGTRQPPSTPSSSKGTVWGNRVASPVRSPRSRPAASRPLHVFLGGRDLPRCAGVAHGGTGPPHGDAELISITPPAPHTGPPTPSAAPPWAVGTVERGWRCAGWRTDPARSAPESR